MLLEAFWKSCYDVRWLLARRGETLGRVAGHLALLALLLAAARMAVVGPAVRRMIDQGAEFIRTEMPEVRVEGGKATTDAPQPWTRSFDASFQLVIDTTGQTQSIDPAYPNGILIARDRIVYRRGPETTDSIELKRAPDFSTRGPKMQSWIEEVRGWTFPVLVPVVGFVTLAGLLLRWTLTAAAASAAAGALGSPLQWQETFKIAAFAATPAVYFVLLGTLTPLRVMLVPTLAHLLFLGIPIWLSKETPEDGASAGPEPGGPPPGE